ncbi:MAG: nicotinamide-nucleotide adenylyltransferase [Candidatus Geothermarchaeota archaeon]
MSTPLTKTSNIALLIGRFQPFHMGHLYAVRYIYRRHESFVIGLGSAFESHTLRNPFTAAERIKMIFLALDEEGIPRDKYYIVPIPDTDIHYTWVSLVKMLVPEFDVVYSNDPLTTILFREHGIKVEPIPFFNRETYSGEEFRRRVINDEPWEDLVPKVVAEYLKTINAVKRIKELSKTDKVSAASK